MMVACRCFSCGFLTGGRGSSFYVLSSHTFRLHTSCNKAAPCEDTSQMDFSGFPHFQPCSKLNLGFSRCRNDDSSQNSRIWMGSASSKSDAMVAPLLSVSSAQANASADSRKTLFSHHSPCIVQCSRACLCVDCPSRQE